MTRKTINLHDNNDEKRNQWFHIMIDKLIKIFFKKLLQYNKIYSLLIDQIINMT